MADTGVDIAENIMKFCIIPYAEQQNVTTDSIINQLYDYHKTHYLNSNKTSSKRGRPKGSKNKDKPDTDSKTVRKRGRPTGSNTKSSEPLVFDD
jgi:hypothetical protein